MHVRGGSQWKQPARRENSIGPLRRAHPASGATWNVQVVRGKMSTRCLWHACRALMVGILLMMIGVSMATIGYYSQDFPIGEYRHNSTVRVKTEQRGLHLNNLSYLGPIIMGVGGFIVVASCVMTFEARDSAAKVVPARFKLSTNGRPSRSNDPGSRRTTTSVQSTDSKTSACQSGRWEQHLGLFKSSPGSDLPTDRHSLTAALIHFSRTLGSPKCFQASASEFHRLSKSGSVPNLNEKAFITSPLLKSSGSPSERRTSRSHHHHHHHNHHNHYHHKHSGILNRVSRESGFLHPGLLRYHRHAISVDETSPLRALNLNDSAHGSQVSFDPTPEIIDIAPVHKKRNKRSDTARKHVLSRQQQIEKEDRENSSPYRERRRSSTMSENSFSSRKAKVSRRASTTSRTCSIDSRCMQNSTHDLILYRSSPEKNHGNTRETNSILSIDKENISRSQLSICSEPMANIKQLSCQSSMEPCVVEEECVAAAIASANDKTSSNCNETKVVIEQDFSLANNSSRSSNNVNNEPCTRPDSLILNTTTVENSTSQMNDAKKYLYRSQSTRSFKKPKLKASKILSSDLDQIYVISSNARSDSNDFFDSIEVITERRSNNFMQFNQSDNDCVSADSKNKIIRNSSSNEVAIVQIEAQDGK